MAHILNYELRNNNGELSAHMGWLFTMLTLHANGSLTCYPSVETLVKEVGVSQPTITKAKKWLVERGAIVEVPYDLRSEILKKKLHHKKTVYQITGIMYIKENPDDENSTYKVIPTVFFTSDEEVEYLRDQLEILGFFDSFSITKGAFTKGAFAKGALAKGALAKGGLHEVSTEDKESTEEHQESTDSTDTKVSVVQIDNVDDLDESKKALHDIPSLSIASSIDDTDGNADGESATDDPIADEGLLVPSGGLQPNTPTSDIEVPPTLRKGVKSQAKIGLEDWVKALLWTIGAETRWAGFNQKKRHYGMGQQVGEAGTLNGAWEMFVQSHPDNDEIASLTPLEIMKDFWGEEWDVHNGWLFTVKKLSSDKLSISTATIVRHFQAYLSDKSSKPYKLSKGKEVKVEQVQKAVQATSNSSLYGSEDENERQRQEIKDRRAARRSS